MTRTVPCAISLENDKKKVPYEGFTRRSDWAGKTLTALLEMCMAPQGTLTAKLMRINDRIQKLVFFNESDESEHSESKFYYSDELSDPELLKSPTHSESAEKSQHSSRMKKFATFS